MHVGLHVKHFFFTCNAFFLCNCLDNVKVQPTKNGNGANIMTSSVLYVSRLERRALTKKHSRFIDSFLNFFSPFIVSTTSHVIDTFSIVLRIGIIYPWRSWMKDPSHAFPFQGLSHRTLQKEQEKSLHDGNWYFSSERGNCVYD